MGLVSTGRPRGRAGDGERKGSNVHGEREQKVRLHVGQLTKRDLSARSRHIRVQLGFVYDALDSGEVEIRYVRSAANPANQLTAPEVADRLARTIDAMSGRPAEGPPLVVDENA